MLYRTLTFTPAFQLPWIAEFVVDCGWCADVVNILNEIDRGQVNPSVLAAHEDLLCCVAKVTSTPPIKATKYPRYHNHNS